MVGVGGTFSNVIVGACVSAPVRVHVAEASTVACPTVKAFSNSKCLMLFPVVDDTC